MRKVALLPLLICWKLSEIIFHRLRTFSNYSYGNDFYLSYFLHFCVFKNVWDVLYWNWACLFWVFNLGVNFVQFYPQRELNPKVGSLHQISDRNFDQKLTQISRVQNESYHLVHLWVNDVQIFGVWSPPYLRPILQDLFEFFEHAKKYIIFSKMGGGVSRSMARWSARSRVNYPSQLFTATSGHDITW